MKTLAHFMLLVTLAVPQAAMAAPVVADDPAWTPLRNLLNTWPYTKDFALMVGDHSGVVFTHLQGNFTLQTPVQTASTSKWPMAMALLGLVADGTIASLDSLASDYVPWWTRDPTDPRSNVSLRHLLSFTSGFGGGVPGNESHGGAAPCLSWQNVSYASCAQMVYTDTAMHGQPGHAFSYNANHLKLAGLMGMHASGLGVQDLIAKYVNEGLGMRSTVCGDFGNISSRVPNPDLSTCLYTTAEDYAAFLSRVSNREVYTAALIAESERDYTPAPIMPAGIYTLYGHYAFGHFLECFDSWVGWTNACEDARVHIDPGAFGFYPWIDRKNGYWAQIVAYEHGDRYAFSGIPEYLRVLAKPYIDIVQRGESLVLKRAETQALSMDALDYMNGCFFHPETCAELRAHARHMQ